MSDPPLDLGFAEPATPFYSGAQTARVLSEAWAAARLYCPACGADRLSPYPNNARVADLWCAACGEDDELKATKGRFGRKVVDGAWSAMTERLAAANTPGRPPLTPSPGREKEGTRARLPGVGRMRARPPTSHPGESGMHPCEGRDASLSRSARSVCSPIP